MHIFCNWVYANTLTAFCHGAQCTHYTVTGSEYCLVYTYWLLVVTTRERGERLNVNKTILRNTTASTLSLERVEDVDILCAYKYVCACVLVVTILVATLE